MSCNLEGYLSGHLKVVFLAEDVEHDETGDGCPQRDQTGNDDY